MLTLNFSDKTVTYDTFVHDVAASVVRMLSEARNDPETISKRQAYAMFGRGNVDGGEPFPGHSRSSVPHGEGSRNVPQAQWCKRPLHRCG